MLNGHLDAVGIDHMDIDPLDVVVKEVKSIKNGLRSLQGVVDMMKKANSAFDLGVEPSMITSKENACTAEGQTT